MCDCLSRIPWDIRPVVHLALARHGDAPIYAACSTLEPNLSRGDFHRVLRWADSLRACPECAPRLCGSSIGHQIGIVLDAGRLMPGRFPSPNH